MHQTVDLSLVLSRVYLILYAFCCVKRTFL